MQLVLRDRAMQAISQGITIVDARADGRPIVYASPSFEELTGYTAAEVEGRNARFLHGPDTDPASRSPRSSRRSRTARSTRSTSSITARTGRRSGTRSPSRRSPTTAARSRTTSASQTDVTERRELEEHARTTRRLEALGQLAGGVAHDFNNLLTVIMGNAFLATQTAAPENRQELDDILIAASKATDLVRQLLAFSRQQPIEPSRVDLNEVVGDARKMLDRLIEATIDVRYDLSSDQVTVLADRGQIEQVVINLAVNARDAMPDGGRLDDPHGHRRTRPDRDAAVEDTGAGHGAGRDRQDLPAVLHDQGGREGHRPRPCRRLRHRRRRGRPYRRHLDDRRRQPVRGPSPLELSAAAAPAGRRRGSPTRTRSWASRRSLVEDNSTVRAIAEELLMAAGCELVLVADAERAIELTEDGEPYDVLITDVVMPRVTGPELARTIREHRPDVPVIFVSGYPQDKFAEAMSMSKTAYVAKPFSLLALQGAFADLVRARCPASAAMRPSRTAACSAA